MDGSGNATFDSSDKILISCGSATIELHKDGTIKIMVRIFRLMERILK